MHWRDCGGTWVISGWPNSSIRSFSNCTCMCMKIVQGTWICISEIQDETGYWNIDSRDCVLIYQLPSFDSWINYRLQGDHIIYIYTGDPWTYLHPQMLELLHACGHKQQSQKVMNILPVIVILLWHTIVLLLLRNMITDWGYGYLQSMCIH